MSGSLTMTVTVTDFYSAAVHRVSVVLSEVSPEIKCWHKILVKIMRENSERQRSVPLRRHGYVAVT